MKKSKKKFYNILVEVLVVISVFTVFQMSYAEQVIDKKGRLVEETEVPTAETTIDPDTISKADRRVVTLDGKYDGPSKNIYSSGIILPTEEESIKNEKEYTLIRHTTSITDLTYEKYQLNQDAKYDRLRLLIITSDGIIEGKNGFFKIDGKIHYFDENGLMVLGACYDDIGNYYFFSYETGELIEEIQVR